jgi:hypothetical protein
VLDGRGQQPPRRLRFAALERRRAGLDELVAFALPFGNRSTSTFYIRAGACMAPIEKERAGPNVDGEFVLSAEVVIQAREQQFLDACVAVALWFRRGGSEGSESVVTSCAKL